MQGDTVDWAWKLLLDSAQKRATIRGKGTPGVSCFTCLLSDPAECFLPAPATSEAGGSLEDVSLDPDGQTPSLLPSRPRALAKEKDVKVESSSSGAAWSPQQRRTQHMAPTPQNSGV
ncbi:hypothetical protein Y1Q_0023085 [Alligator mississippiensis]|uniref:Uncharacterized protein n=1 Tax=Alligator mississippiensis TaxID=8496 RepID=A0A151NJT8_ALLMI|nr:hypothetical protein Y1Q_0023085 [Alligator mississippiensis]